MSSPFRVPRPPRLPLPLLPPLPKTVIARSYLKRDGKIVEGYLRASDISRDRVEDARSQMNVGDTVEAKFMGVDKKNKAITLSIKAKDQEDESAAMKSYSDQASTAMPTLGDIFKEQMENK